MGRQHSTARGEASRPVPSRPADLTFMPKPFQLVLATGHGDAVEVGATGSDRERPGGTARETRTGHGVKKRG